MGDITYVSTDESCLYLAGIKDLCSGELLGYAMMSERMTTSLLAQAYLALWLTSVRLKAWSCIQIAAASYCARDYQKLLIQLDMTVSMSCKGDCWDNAPIENF